MRPVWLTPEALGALVDGTAVTIVLTVVTGVVSMVVGVWIGASRLAGRRIVRAAASTFVEVFRNIPTLIQIIFWAFAFPNLFTADLRRAVFFDNAVVDRVGELTGLAVPYYAFAAGFALVLNTSAHLAELFRAGVGALPSEHVEAARSLGADRRSVFWRVVLPGAVRSVFPAITTRLVHNMKNTSLVSFVAVPDVFNAVQGSITRTFRATEYLLLAAAVYLALATALTLALHQVDRALHRGRPIEERARVAD